ncbi:MAG: hypothetical protein ACE5KY_06825, partial [Candidatus Tectimicrobiota bacterium]
MMVGFPANPQERAEQPTAGLKRQMPLSCVEPSVKRWLVFLLVLALIGCDSSSFRGQAVVAAVNG